MKKVLKMAGVSFLAFLFVGLSVTPVLASVKEHTLSWSPGYDLSSVTVSAASKLVYSVNGSQLAMEYVLNSYADGGIIFAHTVGALLIVFWRSTSDCIPPVRFGNVTKASGIVFPEVCKPLTAQGVTRLVTIFVVGSIGLDSTGSGSLKLVIAGIPRGNYQAEFVVYETRIIVRTTCINCPTVLQSPGPTFGKTVPVRVHENTGAFG